MHVEGVSTLAYIDLRATRTDERAFAKKRSVSDDEALPIGDLTQGGLECPVF